MNSAYATLANFYETYSSVFFTNALKNI